MVKKSLRVLLAGLLLLTFAQFLNAQSGKMEMKYKTSDAEITVKEIARRVVHESLQLGENDYVTIYTWAHTIAMAEALSLEAMKAGAVPTIILDILLLVFVFD